MLFGTYVDGGEGMGTFAKIQCSSNLDKILFTFYDYSLGSVPHRGLQLKFQYLLEYCWFIISKLTLQMCN